MAKHYDPSLGLTVWRGTKVMQRIERIGNTEASDADAARGGTGAARNS